MIPQARLAPPTSCVASIWPGSPSGSAIDPLMFGGDGDDTIQVSGGLLARNSFYGGAGNDRLRGGNGNDVLLGGPGDDLIVGKRGQDLLIGGLGADRIIGNADDDILVAGRATLSNAELDTVMSQWTSGQGTYEERQNSVRVYLRTGGDDATVLADESKDVLTGSSGIDWFYANLGGEGIQDKITDLSAEEFQPDLEFILAD